MKKFLLVSFLIVGLNTLSFAQDEYLLSQMEKGVPDIHFGVSAEMNFNATDIFFGFGLGVEDINLEWGARLNYGFRPYHKKVLIDEGENVLRQYREKLHLISLDLEKRFMVLDLGKKKKIGPYLGSKFGYLFGNYRGVSKSPQDKFLIAPTGGIAMHSKDVYVRAGYMYFNSETDANEHMVTFSITLFFNQNK